MKSQKAPIKKTTTVYLEENIINYLEEIAVANGTSKNKVFRAAVKDYLIKHMKEQVLASPEYQAILDDVRNTFKF